MSGRTVRAVFAPSHASSLLANNSTKELHTVDEMLQQTLSSYFLIIFRCVGVVVVITLVTPYFLLILLPVSLLYSYTQKYYVGTSRELQRWEGVLRSPIYSLFTETLEGVTSIRAFGLQRRFVNENHDKLCANLRAYYPNLTGACACALSC